MVFPYQHCGDLGGQGTTIRVTGGGEETPRSVIRLCGMGIPPSGALDMNRSLLVIIGYLLRGEYEGFRV